MKWMSDTVSPVFSRAAIENLRVDNAPLREGPGHSNFAFRKTETPDGSPVKAVGFVTLEPGSRLRMHRHVDEGEMYYVLSGSGEYYDNDGRTWPVSPGDVALCLRGDRHGICNTGSVPLVFMGVVS